MSTHRTSIVGAAVFLAVFSYASSASAYQRPGATQLVVAAANVNSASISQDGRIVAFISEGALTQEDNNLFLSDVYAVERLTGALARVSRTRPNLPDTSGGATGVPALSGDGRFVAFVSGGPDLPADTNGITDVYVVDRWTGAMERASVATGGGQLAEPSFEPSISSDGRLVAFRLGTDPSLFDVDDPRTVLLRDRLAGTTTLIGDGLNPQLSPDGRFLAYDSPSGLVVRDLLTGQTETGPPGKEASISASGRYVAFGSLNSDLVPGDGNGSVDAFVWDRATGKIERVSVTSAGGEMTRGYPLSISADGRFVAFGGGSGETYVHDRVLQTTEQVQGTSGYSTHEDMSADGRYVVFDSLSLAPGTYENGIYVRDRGPGLGVGGLSVTKSAGSLGVGGWARIQVPVALTGASDPDSDAAPGAASLGAELTSASLMMRPEEEDLLVQLGIASLPDAPVAGTTVVPGPGGLPQVVYRLAFDLGGISYEVRAIRAAASSTPNTPATPYFGLFRCFAISCEEMDKLTGGIGTAGVEVRVSVPLALLAGAQPEAAITNLRASTSLGETGTIALDELSLPTASVSARPRVEIGLAPAGSPESQVAYASASLVAGMFSGNRSTASLPAGQYRVWARVCAPNPCASASVAVSLP